MKNALFSKTILEMLFYRIGIFIKYNERWQMIPVADPNSGPDKWITASKYNNRSEALQQLSKVFDNSKELDRPSLFLLKNIVCANELNIEVDLFMNDYGKMGVFFRYQNENNYISFEIIADATETMFQLRQFSNGIPSILR